MDQLLINFNDSSRPNYPYLYHRPSSPMLSSSPLDLASLNFTLPHLTAVDPSEALLRRDVDDMLGGCLPSSVAWDRARCCDRHLVHPLHRRDHYLDHGPLLHPRLEQLRIDTSLHRDLCS
jgi:beta-1,6-galactosyltransferase